VPPEKSRKARATGGTRWVHTKNTILIRGVEKEEIGALEKGNQTRIKLSKQLSRKRTWMEKDEAITVRRCGNLKYTGNVATKGLGMRMCGLGVGRGREKLKSTRRVGFRSSWGQGGENIDGLRAIRTRGDKECAIGTC